MEEHSKEFLEKLKGLLAFAKEHKNALEHQEIVDYFKGIPFSETQSEKILDYLMSMAVVFSGRKMQMPWKIWKRKKKSMFRKRYWKFRKGSVPMIRYGCI